MGIQVNSEGLPDMGSDDFSEFLEDVPGFYGYLG